MIFCQCEEAKTLKKIIIINGFHSGKDTFVDLAGEFAEVANYSYVDFTRNMYQESGIDVRNKTDRDRILLAKTNKLLEEWGDVPFLDTTAVATDFLEDYLEGDILFIHMRDGEAIARFVEYFNDKSTVKTLLVKRDSGIEPTTKEDAEVENYSYDYIIDNSGTIDDLKEKAETFVLSLYAEGV